MLGGKQWHLFSCDTVGYPGGILESIVCKAYALRMIQK